MPPRKRTKPELELLESKTLLSTSALPVLTKRTFDHALISIGHYVSGFKQDLSKKYLISNLALVAQTVPFGEKELLPLWTADIGEFPLKAGGPHAMFLKIRSDFIAYVVTGVSTGKFIFQNVGGPAGEAQSTQDLQALL
jgi:hypothetical protein